LRSSEYQKKLKSSGDGGTFAPRTPSQLRCYLRMALQRAPSAWPRAFARAAKSCGVRGTLTTLGFAFNIQTGVRRL
jgi:hypothetical protein